MPDLFDNFFNKLNTKINGGKTTHHYGGASQVNTGSFYSYHSTANNNNYWLPKDKKEAGVGVTSDMDDTPRSRFNSVSSEK
ncbi:hypothetical protein DFJ63DRAFT_337055 [Scheffersomyces coipomensis]|uniref:uncharacterized protein n=1 Tax=Scheffersomyces coipomensis TaxID=1788519 RepID=UPI00315DFA0C